MVGKAKEIDGFDKDTIYQDLRKEKRNDVRLIYIIMDLIFSPGVMDIVKELEEDFKDNGNRHYPRLLLLGIVLYCIVLNKKTINMKISFSLVSPIYF